MNNPNSNKKSEFGRSASLKKSEDRYLPRWKVNNRIIYKVPNDPQLHEARTRDLSCAGACLVTQQPMQAAQKVELKIYLDDTTAVEVHGKTLWNKVYPAGNLVGIAFYNTSTDVQNLILKHAFEIRRNDVVNHWFEGWNKR